MGRYEVFKLSPFHGYICNDANMPENPKFCKDMKVRYCCGKKLRAQWSPWNQWSDCSVTCGGGTKKRFKKCLGSRARKQGSALSKVNYNPKCVGEESELRSKHLNKKSLAISRVAQLISSGVPGVCGHHAACPVQRVQRKGAESACQLQMAEDLARTK